MRTVENILVDSQLLEDIHYINLEKPVAFYHAWLKPGEENKIPWHWHPAMQISRLKEGEGRFFVGDMKFKLKAGDGIIVNVNQLHRYSPEPGQQLHLINVLFLPEFVAPAGSLAYKKYVEPILREESRPCLVLRQEIDWQREILDLYEEAFALEEKGSHYPGYELEIHELCSRFWRGLILHYNEFPAWEANSHKITSQVRMKQMLTFITENYWEKITLEDIAASACISKREALRCFRENMWKTPILYLTELRIEKAKQELLTGDKPIVDIAFSCGFESASYFNRVFRKQTGMTPMEYRKHME